MPDRCHYWSVGNYDNTKNKTPRWKENWFALTILWNTRAFSASLYLVRKDIFQSLEKDLIRENCSRKCDLFSEIWSYPSEKMQRNLFINWGQLFLKQFDPWITWMCFFINCQTRTLVSWQLKTLFKNLQ